MDGTVKIWAVDDGVLMKNISCGGVHIYGLKGKRLKFGEINSSGVCIPDGCRLYATPSEIRTK